MSDKKNAETRENPRTARMREVVLADALKLFASEGADAVTALRVAERTGVSRSAIYRHWPSPEALLLDVIDRAVTPHVDTEVTEDLEHDLRIVLEGLRRRMDVRPFRTVFGALLNKANTDEAFIETQLRLVQGVIQPIRVVLTAAAERGELEAGAVDDACMQLVGPLLTQHVMRREAIDDSLIDSVLQTFLSAK